MLLVNASATVSAKVHISSQVTSSCSSMYGLHALRLTLALSVFIK
jgi:hypothetical protein